MCEIKNGLPLPIAPELVWAQAINVGMYASHAAALSEGREGPVAFEASGIARGNRLKLGSELQISYAAESARERKLFDATQIVIGLTVERFEPADFHTTLRLSHGEGQAAGGYVDIRVRRPHEHIVDDATELVVDADLTGPFSKGGHALKAYYQLGIPGLKKQGQQRLAKRTAEFLGLAA